jgi:cysteine-rich repeat protein
MIDDSFTGGYANCRDDCKGYDTSTCEGGGGDLCGNGNLDNGEICDGETIPCEDLASTPPVGTATCKNDCLGWDKSNCKDAGDSGNTGDTGNTGDSGNTGNSGDSGDSGDTGSSSNCGDGILNLGEQCDDGNKINGDGCSSYCLSEKKVSSSGCSVVVF